MKKEKVSNIPGFENFTNYFVDENGDVFSEHASGAPKKLKGCLDTKGYRYVDLRQNGKRKCPKIHRLVGLAFLPKKEGKNQINHIDGDKENNSISNLEWMTNLENMRHSYETGLRQPRTEKLNYQWHGNHKKCKKVLQLTIEGEPIICHKSLAIAARSLNKDYAQIARVCRGEAETGYGFKWEFIK